MSNWREPLLILLTTYLFTFAVATKRCESENGRSYTICDEDEYCCNDDYGSADCCRSFGVVGIIVGIFFLITAIVSGCIFCYCWWKYCSNGCFATGFSTTTTTTTRRVVTTRRLTATDRQTQPSVREIRLVKVETPNQPPSSHSDSNTNNVEPPPPYPSNDPPPSYSEINI